MSVKTERINDMLVEQISHIIAEDVKNHGIGFVTITDAKVSNDLSFAKIYYTCLDDTKRKETQAALDSASGYIRNCLKEAIDIRNIPELKFVYDESIEYGNRIDELIEETHKKTR